MFTQQMRNGCILVMYVNPGPVSSNDRLFTIPFRLFLAFYNPTDLQRFGRIPWISVNCKHSAKLKFHLLSNKKSSPRIIKMKIYYRLQILIDCFINVLCKYIILRYGLNGIIQKTFLMSSLLSSVLWWNLYIYFLPIPSIQSFRIKSFLRTGNDTSLQVPLHTTKKSKIISILSCHCRAIFKGYFVELAKKEWWYKTNTANFIIFTTKRAFKKIPFYCLSKFKSPLPLNLRTRVLLMQSLHMTKKCACMI